MRTLLRGSATLASLLLMASTPGQTTVRLPSLNIAGSTLEWSETYDGVRHVYTYRYAIHAAPTNKAPIACFGIDLSGRIERSMVDADLHENIVRSSALPPPPATMIPVGVTIPSPGTTNVFFGRQSALGFCSRGGSWDVQPGASLGGFIIESKLPPGLRTATIDPSGVKQEEVIETADPGDTFVTDDGATSYRVTTAVIGPSDPDPALLYNGGGQSSEVNAFLRYATPTDNRIKLATGTTAYTVVIFYGATITPSTFIATLNGIDITSRFQPIPGSGQAVTIPLGAGTTKLHMGVDGTKASGGKGTDSDTLTFLVP